MELVEASGENLDALVDRWHTLARTMEDYGELNELAHRDVTDVSRDGFPRFSMRTQSRSTALFTKMRRLDTSHSERASIPPGSTHSISAS
jgi:hypothetical protein